MTGLSTPRVADDTASQIRQVALDLFSEQGFDGTSLQQIADRLGVTKAALYYHYRSKDELLAAVVEPLFTNLEAFMDSAESSEGRKPAHRRQRLAAYVDCQLAHRDVLGFLSRDLAVLGRPAVAKRSLALRDRISTAIAGSDLSLQNRIRVSFALSGVQGAIVTHAEATPDELRGPVLEGIHAALRAVRRDISAAARA